MNRSRVVSLSIAPLSALFALGAGCATAPTDAAEATGEARSALRPRGDDVVADPGDAVDPPRPTRDPGATVDPPAPPPPGTTTVSGVLGRLTVGKITSGAPGGYLYFVQSGDGKVQHVELGAAALAAAGGAGKVVGKKVSARVFPGLRHAAVVHDLVAVADWTPPAPPLPPPVLGNKRWLTVPCRFSDRPSPDPHGPDYFRSLMGAAAPGAGDFWSKASQGRFTVDGSTVLDWQDLPLPASFYDEKPPLARLGLLMSDCLAAADTFVDFQEFDGIALAFSHNLETQLVGGPLALDLDGAQKTYAFGVLSPVEFANQASVVRTMGIGLDMTFSGTAALRLDSPWDVMSQGFGTTNGVTCRSLTPAFGCASVLPAAEQQVRAGWIDPSNIATILKNNSGSAQLDFVGQPALPGHVSEIRLPIDGNRYYTLEARNQAPSTYDQGVPSTNLVLHAMDASPLGGGAPPADALEATTRLRLIAEMPSGTSTYTNDTIGVRIHFQPTPTGYAVSIVRGPMLSVEHPDARAQITATGISCGRGASQCVRTTRFDELVELTAAPVSGLAVTAWHGCDAVVSNKCRVTMDRSKHVSIDTEQRYTDPEPCVCRPSWPVYKCQQICGDNF